MWLRDSANTAAALPGLADDVSRPYRITLAAKGVADVATWKRAIVAPTAYEDAYTTGKCDYVKLAAANANAAWSVDPIYVHNYDFLLAALP